MLLKAVKLKLGNTFNSVITVLSCIRTIEYSGMYVFLHFRVCVCVCVCVCEFILMSVHVIMLL